VKQKAIYGHMHLRMKKQLQFSSNNTTPLVS